MNTIRQTFYKHYETLIIRECKRNNPSFNKIQAIYNMSRALPRNYSANGDYARRALINICLKYNLIKDIANFIVYNLAPGGRFRYLNSSDFKPYDINLQDECISLIACTPIAVFTDYRRPTKFIRKYDDDKL